jgi:hypothetical protein
VTRVPKLDSVASAGASGTFGTDAGSCSAAIPLPGPFFATSEVCISGMFSRTQRSAMSVNLSTLSPLIASIALNAQTVDGDTQPLMRFSHLLRNPNFNWAPFASNCFSACTSKFRELVQRGRYAIRKHMTSKGCSDLSSRESFRSCTS